MDDSTEPPTLTNDDEALLGVALLEAHLRQDRTAIQALHTDDEAVTRAMHAVTCRVIQDYAGPHMRDVEESPQQPAYIEPVELTLARFIMMWSHACIGYAREDPTAATRSIMFTILLIAEVMNLQDDAVPDFLGELRYDVLDP